MGPIRWATAVLMVSFLCACGGGASRNDPANKPDSGAQPTDAVSGVVTFKGAPLAGATVTAFLTNTNSVYQTTTTDANGQYSFSGLQTSGNVPSEFQFWVNKTGYGFYPSVGTGAKVTRFDYTGQFHGNGSTDIAIYFTVIDFVALANGSVSTANFAAYDGSNPLVSLARSGQTATYVDGDDGSLSKGVAWPASRFTDNQDGTFTDHLTGLTWMENVGCFAPTTWADAVTKVGQLATGSCGLTDGSSVGQWRLPNLNELESLVDPSAANPALPRGNFFTGTISGTYWSSTSYWGGQAGSPAAWTIRLDDGRYMNDTNANVKEVARNGVLAVKGAGGGTVALQATGMYVPYVSGDDGTLQMGVPLTYLRWIDNGNGTLTDTVTGLIWLKKADCIHQEWSDAVSRVNSLAEGQCGLTDGSSAGMWRMPNRKEMQSLSDRMETNHAAFFNQAYTWKANNTMYQAPIFSNFIASEYYWTSTTDAGDTSEAWAVYSCDYGVYDVSKAAVGYTLAVR